MRFRITSGQPAPPGDSLRCRLRVTGCRSINTHRLKPCSTTTVRADSPRSIRSGVGNCHLRLSPLRALACSMAISIVKELSGISGVLLRALLAGLWPKRSLLRWVNSSNSLPRLSIAIRYSYLILGKTLLRTSRANRRKKTRRGGLGARRVPIVVAGRFEALQAEY